MSERERTLSTSRLHWRPVLPTRPPDLRQWLAVCRSAEQHGVESVVLALDPGAPDPFGWAAALGRRTATVAFLVVVQSGLSSPTYFVQQVNTLAAVTGARVRVGVSTARPAGQHRRYGDPLGTAAHLQRTDEFLSVCHGLWRAAEPVDFTGTHYRIQGARLTTPWVAVDRSRPEVYLFTAAAPADPALVRHADCVVTTGSPAEVRDRVPAGVGLAAEVYPTGAAGRLADEIAAYQAAGVSQFVLTGAPAELAAAGREVLPGLAARAPVVAAAGESERA